MIARDAQTAQAALSNAAYDDLGSDAEMRSRRVQIEGFKTLRKVLGYR
jgi:hypothetical protein